MATVKLELEKHGTHVIGTDVSAIDLLQGTVALLHSSLRLAENVDGDPEDPRTALWEQVKALSEALEVIVGIFEVLACGPDKKGLRDSLLNEIRRQVEEKLEQVNKKH